jgi:hypothetical protein
MLCLFRNKIAGSVLTFYEANCLQLVHQFSLLIQTVFYYKKRKERK